jgi:hypothetical protein
MQTDRTNIDCPRRNAHECTASSSPRTRLRPKRQKTRPAHHPRTIRLKYIPYTTTNSIEGGWRLPIRN